MNRRPAWRRRWPIAASAGLLFLAFGSIAVSAQPPSHYDLADLKAHEQAFVGLAEKVRPSVVAVRTYRVRHPGSTDTLVKLPFSQGSGFIIDPGGLIATNRHVIEGAGSIMVVLDNGLHFDAALVKYD